MRMNKSWVFGWFVPGLGALAVAGGLLVWQWPSGEPETTHAESDTARIDEVRTTADLVDIRAVRDGAGGLQVTLHIAEGWHVNANPASLDFLIPTAKLSPTMRNRVEPNGNVGGNDTETMSPPTRSSSWRICWSPRRHHPTPAWSLGL